MIFFVMGCCKGARCQSPSTPPHTCTSSYKNYIEPNNHWAGSRSTTAIYLHSGWPHTTRSIQQLMASTTTPSIFKQSYVTGSFGTNIYTQLAPSKKTVHNLQLQYTKLYTMLDKIPCFTTPWPIQIQLLYWLKPFANSGNGSPMLRIICKHNTKQPNYIPSYTPMISDNISLKRIQGFNLQPPQRTYFGHHNHFSSS